jgi:hypothetical protein
LPIVDCRLVIEIARRFPICITEKSTSARATRDYQVLVLFSLTFSLCLRLFSVTSALLSANFFVARKDFRARKKAGQAFLNLEF